MCQKYMADGDARWIFGQTVELAHKLEGLREYDYLKDISEEILFDTYKAALLNNSVAEPFTDFN